MSKLRVAVVGAGRLGGFHAQKLARMEHVELVGVADPVESQRQRVAAECCTAAWADYRELLGRIDAAVVAAPSRLHYALGMDLLAHGVHVLMEKPLAVTTAAADELLQTARRNRLVLQVGHIERFNPALAAVAPHLRGPKYIEAVRASGFTFRSTDVGVVLDLMIHDLDLVLWLVRAEVRHVQALGLSVLGGQEDVANARIEFHNGCVATLSASRVSHQAARRMQVWSARGLASIDFAARTSTLIRPSETLLARRFDANSLTPAQVEHYREHLLEEHLPRQQIQSEAVDALALELADFVEAVRTRRPPRVTGQQGRDAVALAEQILTEIRAHAWDGTAEGPVGPLATPPPAVIPAPHWHLAPSPVLRREAG